MTDIPEWAVKTAAEVLMNNAYPQSEGLRERFRFDIARALVAADKAATERERERAASVLDARAAKETAMAENHKKNARHYKAREASHVARIAQSDAAAIRKGEQ